MVSALNPSCSSSSSSVTSPMVIDMPSFPLCTLPVPCPRFFLCFTITPNMALLRRRWVGSGSGNFSEYSLRCCLRYVYNNGKNNDRCGEAKKQRGGDWDLRQARETPLEHMISYLLVLRPQAGFQVNQLIWDQHHHHYHSVVWYGMVWHDMVFIGVHLESVSSYFAQRMH